MKKLVLFISFLVLFATGASSEDRIMHYNVQEALDGEWGKKFIDGSVKFEFGSGYEAAVQKKDQKAGKSSSRFSSSKYNFQTKERAPVDPKEGCEYVFAATLAHLLKSAKAEGYTKVVNIRGNFKGNLFDSKSQFQCAKGSMITSVQLIGDFTN